MDGHATFRVGCAEVTRIQEIVTDAFAPGDLIPDWDAAVDAPEMSAMVPEHLDADHRHAVISVHSWLVRFGRRTFLVDAGVGNGKSREAAMFDGLKTPFLERIAAAGVAPGEIDHVLLTHLHTDHVGWLTRRHGDAWVPTFPNARVSLSRRELNKYAALHASEGSDTPRGRLYADSILPILDRIAPVEPGGGEEIKGFTFIPSPGHSIDHMSIALASEDACGLFAGDVMHHPMQVMRPEWSSVFSEDRAKGEASRRWALAKAVESGALVFTSHFAGSSAGRVARKGQAFIWEDAEPQ